MSLLVGSCLEVLPTLEAGSVQTCITSPPYWGLRDYGVEGQLGLEKTPEEYVARMVGVFREVRRVLAEDGTLWVNLGDSYTSQPSWGRGGGSTLEEGEPHAAGVSRDLSGLKPKDLVGIPWRVAFALQADGWVLRSDIVWNKPNPMPESVTDRPTKAHEMLFLFSKAKWSGPEGGRFAHVSDEDARWLALLLDAEGSIVVKRTRIDGRCDVFAPQVSIGNTSRELMERVVEIVDAGNILKRDGKNAPMFYWQLAHGLARDLLYRVYPFLIVKPRQARIGIHVDSLTYYRGGKKPERKQRTEAEQRQLVSLWERNKACNRFGTPDLSDVPEPRYGSWKTQRYYYDADAVREVGEGTWNEAGFRNASYVNNSAFVNHGSRSGKSTDASISDGRRNRRSVWTIPSQPFAGAHFAVFPPALVEPCILAGSREGDTVLDPFAGAGTVGVVCRKHRREFVGIELNEDYAEMARGRLGESVPEAPASDEQPGLF